MSTDVYVLQRDLPHVKAGSEFTSENDNPNYYNSNGCYQHQRIHIDTILSSPEWFKKKEQPVMAQYPNEIKGQKLSNFEIEIASVINRFSRENMSDTPDFILATYLNNCLNAYEKATQQKKNWFK